MWELGDYFSRLGGAARYRGMTESEIPLYVATTLAQRISPAADWPAIVDSRFLQAAAPVLEETNRRIAAVEAETEDLPALLQAFCAYADAKLNAEDRSPRWSELIQWAERLR